ncbi:uncharacterized protein LOC117178213 isoform X2 [Belonocnema kinseyi]|uniref:uncharacterized protein LOC117178213 isoform X2 n=1 Tax=Belonocnema kinseyi TaxID=2817044 RepID=UPI00143DE7FA|nr:uncharacterized protein LOC117178213 isoform X2 [Belonocnema kinseyi]
MYYLKGSFPNIRDLNSNPEEAVSQEYEKFDDVDELFKNLSGQIQDKLKQCRENKDKLKLNKPPTGKANNFVHEFLEVKKRFEADFSANTRIYQSSSQSLPNSETRRDINNEKYKLQMSSVDKYVAMLQSQKTAQSDSLNKAVKKYYSLQTQNWVPGAVMTKIKVDSECPSSFSGSLIENHNPLLNSNVNDEEEKRRNKVKNGQLYGFTYKSAPAFKNSKSKKKSFIEEFCELRDKLGVITKNKINYQEENLDLLNTENKGETMSSNFKQKPGIEKRKNRIVTPFGSIRTSFFSKYNPAETPTANRRKRSSTIREDITADWVKGDVIRRGEIMTKNFIDVKNREHTPENIEEPHDLYCDLSPSNILQNIKSIENKSELLFTPINEYSRATPSYTPVNTTAQSKENEQIFQKKDYCTSTITMSTVLCSRNINIQKPNFVITETKVTKLMFPSHQMKLFQNH